MPLWGRVCRLEGFTGRARGEGYYRLYFERAAVFLKQLVNEFSITLLRIREAVVFDVLKQLVWVTPLRSVTLLYAWYAARYLLPATRAAAIQVYVVLRTS